MNTGIHRAFYYHSGEVAEVNDIVRTGGGHLGRVVTIIQPFSELSNYYNCRKKGGILIEEEWDHQKSLLLMTPPDGEQWEDIDFIQRQSPNPDP